MSARTYDVDFKPWRCQHVIYKIVALLSIAPVVADLAQLVANHVVVCVKHCVHIAVQAEQIVHRVHVKFNFDEVVRVRYKSKVNLWGQTYFQARS